MKRLTLILLLFSSTAFAQQPHPVITSVAPDHGPAEGGTLVTIKGADFFLCPVCSPPTPPIVGFGSTAPGTLVLAQRVRLLDSNTIEAVTPAYVAGATDVFVEDIGFATTASTAARKAFTFDPPSPFEPLLLPILLPDTAGAFRSVFRTSADLVNSGDRDVTALGLIFGCGFAPATLVLPPKARSAPECIELTGRPGRIAWVPAGTGNDIEGGMRVFDVSRTSTNFGTRIPLVRARDFRSSRIALLGLPLNPNFRLTLRIYSLEPEATSVTVRWFGNATTVPLRAGDDQFDPAFATFNDFPVPALADPPPQFGDVVIDPDDPSRHTWAFVTATNTETQEITTISQK
ncbi:MAG TPA: IPT/TIG domain-containing protein [Thermoanaerobaculia bacterium]